MTDREAGTIHESVEHMLGNRDGRGLDVGNPAHLALLIEHVRLKLTDVAEDELCVAVVLCWLGPKDAGIPPAAVRDELLGILRRCVPDEAERRERVMEFAIAYGCGKWRDVQPGDGGWAQRWQGAVRGLVRALEPAVAQANRWLAEHVVGFPTDRGISHTANFPEDAWSDAWILATRLIRPEHPLLLEDEDSLILECTWEGMDLHVPLQEYQMTVPPGAKAVWTVKAKNGTVFLPDNASLSLTADATVFLLARDDDVLIKVNTDAQGLQARFKIGEEANLQGPMTLAMWECTCGTTHCVERHRLDAWDPTQIIQKATVDAQQHKRDAALTLWDYVAAAVKGPQLNIKTGAFVQGSYFPLLAQEGLTA